MAEKTRRRAPAKTSRARENQLIALAADLAEKKLLDGTASSQLITTLLQFASTKAKLEMKKLETDIAYTESKKKQLKSADEMKEVYEAALNAFKSYQGSSQVYDDEDYEDKYDD